MFRQVNLIKQLLRSHSVAFASTEVKAVKPIPLITCKHSEYNLMIDSNTGNPINNQPKEIRRRKRSGKKDEPLEPQSTEPEIKLASQNWQHYKAKGDHFIIHPVRDVTQSNLKNSKRFQDFGFNETVVKNLIEKFDITRATKLQIDAITEILNKKNVLIAAETGCGKTHAYILPIIERLIELKAQDSNEREFNTPMVLILTPGRELAEQIAKVAQDLTEGLDINVKVVTGGKTKYRMMNPSFEDVDILVGSIGAISKLTTTGIYRMTKVKFVVLDEADTMLDDSFNEKVSYFLRRFNFSLYTQLVLASATMPTNTDDVFRDIINTDTLSKVVSEDLHKVLPYITQKFIRMRKAERPEYLLRIVKSETDKKRPVIVFSNKSVTSDYVSIFLEENGIKALNLNGDMNMMIREGRFMKFQDGEVHVLSTTDCVARGLNTIRARHIINFDFPLHVSDYIHRCGRIGRLGSNLNCYITNFISGMQELELVRQIEMSARTNNLLENVDANINGIIREKIEKELKKYEQMEKTQIKAAAM